MSFTRITVRADQMDGIPCIRGLRIPVATVVGMLADGMSDPEILAAYPDLEAEDLREAMRYAAEVAGPLPASSSLCPANEMGQIADYVIGLLEGILDESCEWEKRYAWALGDECQKPGRLLRVGMSLKMAC